MVGNQAKRTQTTDKKGQMDCEVIFSRLMILIHYRDIDVNSVMGYELAPLPTSLFDGTKDQPEMRIAKAKATLKKTLQPQSAQGLHDLWSGEHCKEHVITLTTPNHYRDVVLNVAHNKEQLIEMITEELLNRTQGLRLPNRLVVTGKADTPVEVWQGVRVERSDLQTNHEEADVIILHQVVQFVSNTRKTIKHAMGRKLDQTTACQISIQTFWVSSMGRKSAASVHQLKTLPLQVKRFFENVRRAHFKHEILGVGTDWRGTRYGPSEKKLGI
ncbi:hypothetical protein GWK47_006523 [Chionoecetes opilio]|uniref:Uncharacterized protein n=1 Tax=Chionoecetes opilio TaxID=41210 RepID=A0A8J5CVP0_CHIOP|nr:hypothetical protein GWK47_006523 [Chionoecetes opilio]